MLAKLQNELGPKGFQALGAAINEQAGPAVPQFISVLKIPYPLGVGSADAAVAFLEHPIKTKMMMPQVVFIDRAGRIQAQFDGNHPMLVKDAEQNLRATANRLLSGSGDVSKPAKSAPAAKPVRVAKPVK